MSTTESSYNGFLSHDAAVRKLIRHLLLDESAVDDVMQETWLAALAARPSLTRSPRAWLGTVARRFALKARIGASRRLEREKLAACSERVPSPVEILEREAARRNIVEAVLSLEEPYRYTVVLRYFENLPPREVARRLSVPVETVRTRLKRALIDLRTALEREYGPDSRSLRLVLLMCAGHRRTVGGRLCLAGLTLMTTKLKVTIGAAALTLLSTAADLRPYRSYPVR
ncbi:MAG: sigma-70 family RNA polymerase sigma factor [Planctomycetota bacterium]